jgi:ketosteroid isomerase-like protein
MLRLMEGNVKAIRILTMATSLIVAGAAVEEASAKDPVATPTIQQLVGTYAAAWGSHDPARIAALHSADTIFDLRVDGKAPALGREAAQQRFAGILRDNPSYSSTVRKVDFGATFVVIEYMIAMNPPAPFQLGRLRYVPTGEPYSVPAIDVIRFREGLVSEKVTFLDTDTIRANSRNAAPVGASR